MNSSDRATSAAVQQVTSASLPPPSARATPNAAAQNNARPTAMNSKPNGAIQPSRAASTMKGWVIQCKDNAKYPTPTAQP